MMTSRLFNDWDIPTVSFDNGYGKWKDGRKLVVVLLNVLIKCYCSD